MFKISEKANPNYLAKVVKLSGGRNDKFRKQTEQFLEKEFFDMGYELFMRRDKDQRKDCIVKQEMFDYIIKDKYCVDFVLDDRLQMIRMWEKLGIFVFNCNISLKEF